MSGRHIKEDPAASVPKTSWFKSKAAKAFSFSKSSKPGTIKADSNEATSSKIKASSQLPLRECQSQLPVGLRPIFELWDEAYDELRKKDQSLVAEYEAQLSKSVVWIFLMSSLI
jgi:hypothetical protein